MKKIQFNKLSKQDQNLINEAVKFHQLQYTRFNKEFIHLEKNKKNQINIFNYN